MSSCLQSYLENSYPDLFQNCVLEGKGGVKLRVIVDSESCLSRFYGGARRDWLCGGQWSQMWEHLNRIKTACEKAEVSLSFFFRGLQDQAGGETWKLSQTRDNARCKELFRKLAEKCDAQTLSSGMSPYYVEPAGLRTFFRLALLSLNFPVVQSFENYERDLVEYANHYGLDGILTDNMILCLGAAKRIRCFLMKDSWIAVSRSGLEVEEFRWEEFLARLELNLARTSILVALLNCSPVRAELMEAEREENGRGGRGRRGSAGGGRDGRPSSIPPRGVIVHRALTVVRNLPANRLTPEHVAFVVFHRLSMAESRVLASNLRKAAQIHNWDRKSGFAEEYAAPDDVRVPKERDENGNDTNSWQTLQTFLLDRVDRSLKRDATFGFQQRLPYPRHSSRLLRQVAAYHRRGVISPFLFQLASTGQVWLDSMLGDQPSSHVPYADVIFQRLRENIYRFVFDGETRRPSSFVGGGGGDDDDDDDESTSPASRRSSSSKTTATSTSLILKEFSVPKGAVETHQVDVPIRNRRDDDDGEEVPPAQHPDDDFSPRSAPSSSSSSSPRCMEDLFASACTFSHSPFASDQQKAKLLHFRACFHDLDSKYDVDATNRLRSRGFPPAFEFLSSLLKYFLFVSNNGNPFFTCQMMDATLATLVSPVVRNAVLVRSLSPPQMTPESVAYAALLMRGLEWIVFVNDVCGSPFNPTDLLPSSFFDGKIFQEKFLKAKNEFSLLEICDGRADQASLVEQMREIVVAGTDYSFLAPTFTFAAFRAKMASSSSSTASPSAPSTSWPIAGVDGRRSQSVTGRNASSGRRLGQDSGWGKSTFRGSGAKSFVDGQDYMQLDDVNFFQGDGRLASAQRWNERGWMTHPRPTRSAQQPRRPGHLSSQRTPRGVVLGAAASKPEPKVAMGRGTFLRARAESGDESRGNANDDTLSEDNIEYDLSKYEEKGKAVGGRVADDDEGELAATVASISLSDWSGSA